MGFMRYCIGRIIKKLQISAVKNSDIHRTSNVCSGCQIVNVSMDRYSYCGYDCVLINCKIGSFTSIAGGVVAGGAQHPISWVSTSPAFYCGKRVGVDKKFSEFERELDRTTVIGNDVWIGNNVLIKGGVTIGDGAVIGMGSVVTKDIPPFEIWAGNPAKKIRDRFDDDVKDKLLELKWWKLEDEKIQKYAKYIKEPEKFITEIKDMRK